MMIDGCRLKDNNMIDISERRIVHCPNPQASDYLAAFVADHQPGAGRVCDPLTDCTNVVASYPLKSAGNHYPTYSLTWSPEGGGRSAAFVVVKSAGKDCFGLTLSGHCTLRGAVGATCDAASGRRIVRVSVRNVLRMITNYIENARAHNEAALAGHRPMTYLSVTSSQRRVDAVSDLRRSSDAV
jgi:hypothetical protein